MARPDFGLLEERDFVRRRVGSSLAGEREYVIKHALTREVAYASLPKAVRAHLHAAFAGWLERRAEGDDEHAALLAYHYPEAVRPEDVDLAWAGRDEQLAERRRQGDDLGAAGRRRWRSAATRSTRRSPCSTGRSSSSRIPPARRSSGTRSATRTALKFDGERVLGGDGEVRSSSAAPRRSSTPSSRWRPLAAGECGGGNPTEVSSPAGSSKHST